MEAHSLRYKSACYILNDGVLYKRGSFWSYLHYQRLDEVDYVLREIHDGICGNHFGGKAFAYKAQSEDIFSSQHLRIPSSPPKSVVNVNVIP